MKSIKNIKAIILFRPTYSLDANSVPTIPWALLYVAAPLAEEDYEVILIDEPATPSYHDFARKLLLDKEPVVVGITSMTGAQIRYGLEFARFVREHSDAKIVWGGIHPTLKPEQTVRHELVDYVVAGEGEFIFRELVKCIVRGENAQCIPGVFEHIDGEVHGVKQDGFLDFSSLPEPPFHLLDMEKYICSRSDLGVKRYSEICTSRGCVHRCSFCYVQNYHDGKWRYLEAGEVVQRIKSFTKRFNVDCVLFREDNFFVNRKRVERIAQGLIDEDLGIKWAASCRINYFAEYSPEFIDLLKRSGCSLLTFGVESGSDRVLDFIHKDIKVESVIRVAKMLHESGIRSTFHFMGGFPTETIEEFLDTCRLIQSLMEISPDIVPREMSVMTPFPGLPILSDCIAGGFKEPENLEDWMDMDWWNSSARPWLSEKQVRILEDALFLEARLLHPNSIVRNWVRLRWKQMLNRPYGVTLFERPAFNFLRRLLHNT